MKSRGKIMNNWRKHIFSSVKNLFLGATQRMAKEDGAVTVDWVVLTATMTVIGGMIVGMTIDGTTDVGNQIGSILTNKEVN
jgi:hypothetical protein